MSENLLWYQDSQRVEQTKGLEVKDANITLLGLCKKCKEELASNAN